jgi:hypothetical protein
VFSATASATVTNTTVETSLINATGAAGSLTIPANFFGVGSTLQASISGAGVATNGANRTLRIRVKLGGITVCDSGIQTLANIGAPVAWAMTANTNYTGAALRTSLTFHYGVGNAEFTIDGSGAFNPAAANAYDITATWGNASAANAIVSNQCVLRRLY